MILGQQLFGDSTARYFGRNKPQHDYGPQDNQDIYELIFHGIGKGRG